MAQKDVKLKNSWKKKKSNFIFITWSTIINAVGRPNENLRGCSAVNRIFTSPEPLLIKTEYPGKTTTKISSDFF